MKELIAPSAPGCAVLTGCNTMMDMGEDVQTDDRKLENMADNTKQKM